jgi:hypothetical protein
MKRNLFLITLICLPIQHFAIKITAPIDYDDDLIQNQFIERYLSDEEDHNDSFRSTESNEEDNEDHLINENVDSNIDTSLGDHIKPEFEDISEKNIPNEHHPTYISPKSTHNPGTLKQTPTIGYHPIMMGLGMYPGLGAYHHKPHEPKLTEE